MSRPAMELQIDWTLCDGHGPCSALLPERIGVDEFGFPVIARTPLDGADGALLTDARRAVAACPRLALRLEQSAHAHA